jgi:hypothetical protein
MHNQLSTTPWIPNGSGIIAPPFLNSALDGGELSVSCPSRFTLGIYFVGGWMGPRGGPDPGEMIKATCLNRESRPGRPARNPSYTSWATQVHTLLFAFRTIQRSVITLCTSSWMINKQLGWIVLRKSSVRTSTGMQIIPTEVFSWSSSIASIFGVEK